MNLQALTGPMPYILDAQSQPHKIHMSINYYYVKSNPSNTFYLVISVMGYFLLLSSRNNSWVPNTMESVSSVHTASTLPILLRQLHWAQAYPGACITGTPIKTNIFFTSYFQVWEIYVVLCCCFNAQSRLPTSSAYYFFQRASCLTRFLLKIYPFFLLGGGPSNTHTGLIPCYSNKMVRLKSPSK